MKQTHNKNRCRLQKEAHKEMKEPAQEYTGKDEDNAATPTPTRDKDDNTHCALET